VVGNLQVVGDKWECWARNTSVTRGISEITQAQGSPIRRSKRAGLFSDTTSPSFHQLLLAVFGIGALVITKRLKTLARARLERQIHK